MFIAGLETDVAQMRKVGLAAFLAATGGVALPMAAGIGLGFAFGMGTAQAFFLGTVLTATSVGITAQTLTELGKLQSREGSAILAAAVIDDVMGVFVLSLVLGFSGGGNPAFPIMKMALFIPLAFVVGIFVVPVVIDRILHLHERETRTAIVIGIALVYAWSAEHWGGLAAITGAYIAGMMVARTETGEHATESMNKNAYAFFILTTWRGLAPRSARSRMRPCSSLVNARPFMHASRYRAKASLASCASTSSEAFGASLTRAGRCNRLATRASRPGQALFHMPRFDLRRGARTAALPRCARAPAAHSAVN